MKKGLAKILAAQTGAQVGQIEVVQLIDEAAVVLVKSLAADQAVQANADGPDPGTRIMFRWIRYRRPLFCTAAESDATHRVRENRGACDARELDTSRRTSERTASAASDAQARIRTIEVTVIARTIADVLL